MPTTRSSNCLRLTTAINQYHNPTIEKPHSFRHWNQLDALKCQLSEHVSRSRSETECTNIFTSSIPVNDEKTLKAVKLRQAGVTTSYVTFLEVKMGMTSVERRTFVDNR